MTPCVLETEFKITDTWIDFKEWKRLRNYFYVFNRILNLSSEGYMAESS